MRKRRTKRTLEERKHPLVYRFIMEVAASCDEFTEYLKAVTDPAQRATRKKMEAKVWLWYCRRPVRFWLEIFTEFGPKVVGGFITKVFKKIGESAFPFLDEFKTWGRDKIESVISETFRQDTSVFKKRLKSGEETDEIETDDSTPCSNANLFLCLTVFPCYMHYRTTPWVLYRLARRGDIDAICKLIQLDSPGISPALSDDSILRHVCELERNDFPRYCRTIQKAMLGDGLKEAGRARVKGTMAASLQLFLEILGGGTDMQSYPDDFREALCEVAEARKGELGAIDMNIQSPRAWSKRIERERDMLNDSA